jgi:hypothetical protein
MSYTYCCSNEYNYKELLNYINTHNGKFKSYGYNVITDTKYPNIGKYYVREIGEIKGMHELNNNVTKPSVIYKSKLINTMCQLNRVNDKKSCTPYFKLNVMGKEYRFNYCIDMLKYFYIKTEKEFFERESDICYIGDIVSADQYISVKNKSVAPDNRYRMIINNDIIKNCIPHLSDNYVIIYALLSLGIRKTDIGRLMGTSQAYISRTIPWIKRRINKLAKKNKLNIIEYDYNEYDEISEIIESEQNNKVEVTI